MSVTTGYEPADAEYDDDRQDDLRRFVNEGLVWLVNTAVLHPRGYALAYTGAPDDPDGLVVIRFGDYTAYDPGLASDEGVVERYEEAEADRERRDMALQDAVSAARAWLEAWDSTTVRAVGRRPAGVLADRVGRVRRALSRIFPSVRPDDVRSP